MVRGRVCEVQTVRAVQQFGVTFRQEIRQKTYAKAVSVGKGSAPKKRKTSSHRQ